MTPTPRFPGFDASAKIRLAFGVLSGFVAIRTGTVPEVLPWLLLVVVLDLVVVVLEGALVYRRGITNTVLLTLLCASAAAAGAGYALTDTATGASAATALLVLIPAYHAGSKYGRFGFLLTCVVASIAFLVSALLYTQNDSLRVGLIAWIGAAHHSWACSGRGTSG